MSATRGRIVKRKKTTSAEEIPDRQIVLAERQDLRGDLTLGFANIIAEELEKGGAYWINSAAARIADSVISGLESAVE